MTDNQNIPIPDKSGISGNQEAAYSNQFLQETKPLDGLYLAKTIEGLATTHARSLGGEVSSALIAGVTTQLAVDYKELKEQHNKLSNKPEIQRDDLEKTRTKNAVLRERIQSENRNKNLKNLCIAIGTALFGIGITLSQTSFDMYAFSAYGSGAILLIFGWISSTKENEE